MEGGAEGRADGGAEEGFGEGAGGENASLEGADAGRVEDEGEGAGEGASDERAEDASSMALSIAIHSASETNSSILSFFVPRCLGRGGTPNDNSDLKDTKIETLHIEQDKKKHASIVVNNSFVFFHFNTQTGQKKLSSNELGKFLISSKFKFLITGGGDLDEMSVAGPDTPRRSPSLTGG